MNTIETTTHWKTETGEPVLYSETWSRYDLGVNSVERPEFGEGLWVLVASSAKVPPNCTRCTEQEYLDLRNAEHEQFLEGMAERTKEMLASREANTKEAG